VIWHARNGDAWLERAACRGTDPNLFHPRYKYGEAHPTPEDERREAEAKALCWKCPVSGECLALGMSQPESPGIYGGLTAREREKRRRERRERERAWAARNAS
jgi:WhiB family redox-sensing transcriptional regulator